MCVGRLEDSYDKVKDSQMRTEKFLVHVCITRGIIQWYLRSWYISRIKTTNSCIKCIHSKGNLIGSLGFSSCMDSSMSCNTKFDLSKIKRLVYTAKLQRHSLGSKLCVHVLVSLGTTVQVEHTCTLVCSWRSYLVNESSTHTYACAWIMKEV